jgi:hypothetical protein
MNKGNIVQVIGPVVDVEFPDEKALPKICNALEIEYEVNGNPTKLTLEVRGQQIVLSKEPAWKKLRGSAAGTDLVKAFAADKKQERKREDSRS